MPGVCVNRLVDRLGKLEMRLRKRNSLSRFNNYFDDPVREFKLLRGTSSEKCINTFPDISWVLFAFQKKEDVWFES